MWNLEGVRRDDKKEGKESRIKVGKLGNQVELRPCILGV
jgi:hypothetical protein